MTDRKLSRRAVGAWGGLGLLGACASIGAGPGRAEPVTRTMPFSLDQSASIDVQSDPVRWKGQDYRLVALAQIQFQLAPDFRLTANLKGRILTFDKVDYELSAAVFGEGGTLLGTARVLIPVQRLWLRTFLAEAIQPKLDFGISEAYRNAKTFQLSISQRRVLTPDEWQR